MKCWAGCITSWKHDCQRNINNLRYVDDTLMGESEDELKSPLMRVKGESEKADLKPSIKKTKIIKPKQGLCINLEGWDGEGDGRAFQKGGDICIPMGDSC